jgi:hypothetical protein
MLRRLTDARQAGVKLGRQEQLRTAPPPFHRGIHAWPGSRPRAAVLAASIACRDRYGAVSSSFDSSTAFSTGNSPVISAADTV